MNIKDYLKSNVFTSRKYISKITGKDERTIREKISKLKEKEPVIYNSQTKGYRLAKPILEMDLIEIEEEIKAIEHCINDINARQRSYENYKQTYFDYLEEAKGRKEELITKGE